MVRANDKHFAENNRAPAVIMLCSPRIYIYNGKTFEYGPMGCWPLKKNLEQRALAGRRFYDSIADFFDLTDKEREQYRAGGGCVAA